jgi:uncharacterized Zn-binding protein involved in type VI secretion
LWEGKGNRDHLPHNNDTFEVYKPGLSTTDHDFTDGSIFLSRHGVLSRSVCDLLEIFFESVTEDCTVPVDVRGLSVTLEHLRGLVGRGLGVVCAIVPGCRAVCQVRLLSYAQGLVSQVDVQLEDFRTINVNGVSIWCLGSQGDISCTGGEGVSQVVRSSNLVFEADLNCVASNGDAADCANCRVHTSNAGDDEVGAGKVEVAGED